MPNADAQIVNVIDSNAVLQGPPIPVLLFRADLASMILYRRYKPIGLAIQEEVMVLRGLLLSNTKAEERLLKVASMERVLPQLEPSA